MLLAMARELIVVGWCRANRQSTFDACGFGGYTPPSRNAKGAEALQRWGFQARNSQQHLEAHPGTNMGKGGSIENSEARASAGQSAGVVSQSTLACGSMKRQN